MRSPALFFFGTRDRRITTKILVAVVSIAIAGFDIYGKRDMTPLPWELPVVLAVMMVLLEAVFALEIRLEEKMLSNEEDIAQRVAAFQRNNHGRLSLHLKVVHEMITTSLHVFPEERLYSVQSRSQAIDTYHEYWTLLVAKQRDLLKSRGGKLEAEGGLRVRAIHSTSVDIWLGKSGWLGDAILMRHKEFREHGGSIERILVHRDATPSEEYQRAIDRMKEVGVTVRYLKADAADLPRLSRWDFMLIGLRGGEESDEAVIWAETDDEGNPTEAVYSCAPKYKEKDLNELWDHYREKSQQQ